MTTQTVNSSAATVLPSSLGWRDRLRLVRALTWMRAGSAWEWAKAGRFTFPGIAGAGLISAAAGLRFGVWAGLAVAGVFCLRLDSRIG